MRGIVRNIKRHYGATAKRVAVRSQRPWYWRWVLPAVLISLGYLLAYWQFTGGSKQAMQILRQENQLLRINAVRSERKLQVARAAQTNLAQELKVLQDESMRLKEDVAFYKNILSDNADEGELKFHSFRLSKTADPRRYNYYILLTHSPGRNKKAMQGQIQFTLITSQGAKTALMVLPKDGAESPNIKVDFKYYQRLEGSVRVAEAANGADVVAEFVKDDGSQSRISQKATLPI